MLRAIDLERFGADGLLRSLVGAPGQHRRDLGRQLIARLGQDAAAAGIEELVLLTETAEPIFRTSGYAAINRTAVNDPLKHNAELAFRSMDARIKLFLCLPITRLDQLRLKQEMAAIGNTPASAE